MQNFRVENLENLLLKIKDEGVTIIGEMELMIMENLVGFRS
jgi:D-3-phosphoglycerate dehydrogenase